MGKESMNDFLITLIRPANVLPSNSHQGQQGVPPLGMAYIAGALKAAAFQTVCIDGTGESLGLYHHIEGNFLAHGLRNEDIVKKISTATKVIGISCMFANEWFYTQDLVEKIRQQFPKAVIVLGGEFATADYKFLLTTYKSIDYVVHGEGEESFVELCQNLQSGGKTAHLSGVSFLDKTGEVQFHAKRARIKNIDEIAWPDWSGIPLENYLSLGYGHDTLQKRSIPMLASRGCPYRCSFCTSPQMWTQKWIARDQDRLLDEIRFNLSTYKINHIEFYDLTTIINREWIISFCQKMIASNLNLSWSLPSGTRSEVLDDEVLMLLKQSGCSKLTLAPESGSEETLKKIRKKVKPKNMLKVIKRASKMGITTKLNIIYGFPEQTLKNIFETVQFIVRAALDGANDVACFAFVPYPGTELFNDLIKNEKIKVDSSYPKFLSNLVNTKATGTISWSEHISNLQLNACIILSMGLFYAISFTIRPIRFARLVDRLMRGKPFTMLEMLLYGFYRNFILGKKSKALKLKLKRSE